MNIVIIGVGSVGCEVIKILIKYYPEYNLTIIDYDKIEKHNRFR